MSASSLAMRGQGTKWVSAGASSKCEQRSAGYIALPCQGQHSDVRRLHPETLEVIEVIHVEPPC